MALLFPCAEKPRCLRLLALLLLSAEAIRDPGLSLSCPVHFSSSVLLPLGFKRAAAALDIMSSFKTARSRRSRGSGRVCVFCQESQRFCKSQVTSAFVEWSSPCKGMYLAGSSGGSLLTRQRGGLDFGWIANRSAIETQNVLNAAI